MQIDTRVAWRAALANEEQIVEMATETEMNAQFCGSEQSGSLHEPRFRLEPFVDAKTVSAFLSIPRADVLRMTREGKIRGYPYKGRLRHVYRYRLSEVSADFEALACSPKRTMREAPVSRRRKSNG